MGTETTIYNTRVVSVDQKALANTYTSTDCSNDVLPDHEDLVDCTCRLMSAKDSCTVNDKVMLSVKNEKLIKVNKTTTAGLLRSCYRQLETIKLFPRSILSTPIKICYNNLELKVLSTKKADKNKDSR